MRWIDGNELNIKTFSGETLCEKLATELWNNPYDQWLKCTDFIQVASFLIAFDTELTMEGIFTFLENSISHYSPNIIQAFRAIGDSNDADTLEEICRLAPPDIMRGEFLSEDYQEYYITTFNAKSSTTSSTGGLPLALQRAILLLAPKGGIASTFTGPL